MTLQIWLAFVAACCLISVSPGAGAIASMTCGLNQGIPRGLWNILGLQLALLLQLLIVAAGVGVLFATSTWAFQLVKWFGVLYLLYLAYGQWSAPIRDFEITPHHFKTSGYRLVLRGFVVNMSNPKAIVFLLAVLPQFLNVSAELGPQYLLMFLTMMSIDVVVMSIYTGLAAKVLILLKSPRQQKFMNRSFAVLFAAAAVILSTLHQSG